MGRPPRVERVRPPKRGFIDGFGRALDFVRRRVVDLVLTHSPGEGGGANPILGICGTEVEALHDGPGELRKRGLLEQWLRRARGYRSQNAVQCGAPIDNRDSLLASAGFEPIYLLLRVMKAWPRNSDWIDIDRAETV